MKAELRIYGVSEYFTQPYTDKGDYSFYDYSAEEIENLSGKDFIQWAENNGEIYTLNGFLRDLEVRNTVKKGMQFRAFLINTEDTEEEPIRVDVSDMLLRVSDVSCCL